MDKISSSCSAAALPFLAGGRGGEGQGGGDGGGGDVRQFSNLKKSEDAVATLSGQLWLQN